MFEMEVNVYRLVVKIGMKTLLRHRVWYLQGYLDCQEDQEDPEGGQEINSVNICHLMIYLDLDFVKRKQKTYSHLSHLCHFLLQTLWDLLVRGAQGALELLFLAEVRDS